MAVASLAVLTGLSGSIEAMQDLPRSEHGSISAMSRHPVRNSIPPNWSGSTPNSSTPCPMRRWPSACAISVCRMTKPRRSGAQCGATAPAFGTPPRGARSCSGNRRPRPSFRTMTGRSWRARSISCRPHPGMARPGRPGTDRVKAETGRKGRALFMPLRVALTGLEHGPELADLLPLIGVERATARRP